MNQALPQHEGCHVEAIGRIELIMPAKCAERVCVGSEWAAIIFRMDPEHATGSGCILRDEDGGNAIVIVPGSATISLMKI